ncbi:hypothetical protein J6590_076014 [Homalodisca vitripennis]|nr:hypothetical protein J6590_076014 [Homalodisca vitripennis]
MRIYSSEAACKVYSSFCDAVDEGIVSFGFYDDVILLGDFNLPDADWSSPDVLYAGDVCSYLNMDKVAR